MTAGFSNLLHLADSVFGVSFGCRIDFDFTTHRIHLSIRPSLVLIGCAALYNSCAGSRMGLFVCFYFLISFF